MAEVWARVFRAPCGCFESAPHACAGLSVCGTLRLLFSSPRRGAAVAGEWGAGLPSGPPLLCVGFPLSLPSAAVPGLNSLSEAEQDVPLDLPCGRPQHDVCLVHGASVAGLKPTGADASV